MSKKLLNFNFKKILNFFLNILSASVTLYLKLLEIISRLQLTLNFGDGLFGVLLCLVFNKENFRLAGDSWRWCWVVS